MPEPVIAMRRGVEGGMRRRRRREGRSMHGVLWMRK